MATQFEVDVQRLNTDIERAKGSLNYIKSNLKIMFGEIKELDSMWDGKANNAFNIQFNNDYEMMQSVCKNLESLISALETSRQDYIKCENQVASAIRSMKF